VHTKNQIYKKIRFHQYKGIHVFLRIQNKGIGKNWPCYELNITFYMSFIQLTAFFKIESGLPLLMAARFLLLG